VSECKPLPGGFVRLDGEAEKVCADADAAEAAAKLKEAAAAEAEAAGGILRAARAERAALDAEKAAMEMTYAFQASKIKLNVGGRGLHSFTDSFTVQLKLSRV
jgi:hypothetical protein